MSRGMSYDETPWQKYVADVVYKLRPCCKPSVCKKHPHSTFLFYIFFTSHKMFWKYGFEVLCKKLGHDRMSAKMYFKNHKEIISDPHSPIHKP